MIATVTGVAAAGTVLLVGGAVYAVLVLAAAELAHLAGENLEQHEQNLCDHAHTVYLGDVLIDANAGNRWLDSWAPVDRCVACGVELVGAPRYTR